MEALEAHSAYSTHYCSQEPGSEEEEEQEDAVSLAHLKASLQVVQSWKSVGMHVRPGDVPFLLTCCLSCPTPEGRGQPEETGRGGYSFPVRPEK